jgi:hypothetical protein
MQVLQYQHIEDVIYSTQVIQVGTVVLKAVKGCQDHSFDTSKPCKQHTFTVVFFSVGEVLLTCPSVIKALEY